MPREAVGDRVGRGVRTHGALRRGEGLADRAAERDAAAHCSQRAPLSATSWVWPPPGAGRGRAPSSPELLERIGLGPYAQFPAGDLAYGLQRRVETARALAGDPALLLLDEPLAGFAVSDRVSFS
ncbi:ATP-binding cassette domain-containing protein [Streptomyces tendae]|uniref:ATP-binding cassette domain-containing protein n=1 Tax=Streptomyces tendae TaxID=1932 RepID=UPI00368C369A